MSLEKTVISVVVISYNSEKTIKRTISSILNQKGIFETEIIVVDDGSEDSTINIVKKINEQTSAGIKIISRVRSDGIKNVFERINNSIHRGIAAATGQYVRIIAADDYFFEDTVFEKQLSVLENQQDYIACVGKFYYGFYGGRLVYQKAYDMSQEAIDRDTYLKNGSYIHISAVLIRNIFAGHETEWEIFCFDDVAMMFFLLWIGKIAIVDEFISVYSQGFLSVFNGFSDRKRIMNDMATITGLMPLKKLYGKEFSKIVPFFSPALKRIYQNKEEFVEIADEEWKRIFTERDCIFFSKLSGNFMEWIWAWVMYVQLLFLGRRK